MLDVEEAAGLGSVNDLVKGVGFSGRGIGVERDVFRGEEMLGDVYATGFVADVFVGGAAVFGGRGRWSGGGGRRSGGGGVVVVSEGLGLRLGFEGEIGGF